MLIVLNPTAGRRHRHRLQQTLDALAARGVSPELQETRQPGDAAVIARTAALAGETLVMAAGGDGTVAEVVDGLMSVPAGRGSCALGLLPLGTANVLAHELAVPLTPAALADLVVRRHTRPIWPGVLALGGTTRSFVQMVGAGFDAHVVRCVDLGLKRRIGGLAYVWQGLLEAGRYRFPPIEVIVDGTSTATRGVIVTKGRLYAGRYRLASQASPLEPGFVVVLLDRPGALAALACGLALPLGQVARLPGVRMLPARAVKVIADAVPVQADGDPVGTGSFEVRSAGRPLDVLMD